MTTDTTAPTVTSMTMSDTSLTAGESATLTIVFSESVTNFSNAHLNVPNGTLSNVANNDEGLGITWTATFTPDDGVDAANNVITLDLTSVADLAGNLGETIEATANFSIDTVETTPPTATVTVVTDTLAVGDTSVVNIVFSEAVSGFSADDLTVEGGTISTPTTGDGGLTWTATLSPATSFQDLTNTITLDMTRVSDAAGNSGVGTAVSNSYAVDTTPPTATITMTDTALAFGETSLVTIQFDDWVNGFDASDLTISNGTLSALNPIDEGSGWTATFTPTAGINDTTNTITVNNAGVTDLRGNAGTGNSTSDNYTVDTRGRLSPTITVSDATLKAGETATVVFNFSEAVTGMGNEDITVANGTLSALTMSNGGRTYTATLTPNAATTDTTNVITVDSAGLTDAQGAAGAGATSSANYVVDTVAPVNATVTFSDTTLTTGETSVVTITFNEAVTGLTLEDLNSTNATLSNLVNVGGEGLAWTATLTPSEEVNAPSNGISVNMSGVTDLAGNMGVGGAGINYYAINTVIGRPTATITVATPSLVGAATSSVAINFSEIVTGFDLGDLTIANGTLSNLQSTDGGASWTATLTPDAGVQDYSNVITLDNTALTDGEGNAGLGTTTSNNYMIDNKGPSATISMADTALASGETSLVTITFSEFVTGFDASDLTVQNGTIGAVSAIDEGMTWTATFTPAADVADSSNVITLNNAGVTDGHLIAGVGTTQSGNYSVTTRAPTPTPTPTPPPAVVDGVQVVTKVTTAADGSKTETITIPTVTDSRTNTDGAASVADIPLVTSSTGATVLSVGVPTGMGLLVSGPATAQDASAALDGLTASIASHGMSVDEKQALTSAASDFLNSLALSGSVNLRTFVPNAKAGGSGGSSDAPFVITGTEQASGVTALVIDTRSTTGINIKLDNVEFAAVIGLGTVTGGAGRNYVVGDGSKQTIVLGEDDDVLRGGGGDDIVGSAGGNDQIFGDEGNDIVFGGSGNDLIDGGSGHDIVQLAGAGRGDYAIRVVNGELVMTQRDGGADGTDTVSNVEVLRFSGAADVAFNDIDVASLVRLYDTAFGRAADEAGINFWIEQVESGVTLGDIAAGFVASAEAQPQYASLSNEAYVAALYVDGLGRTGGAAEAQFWIDHLNHGDLTRGETLLAFADSAEKIALVGVIDTSIETI